jgi:acyl transferase domain-containing protein/NAD(P)-dependent dehydrogenase (short-subunit alcohol dehydrogenase family)/acyl carrier protein
LSVQTNGTAAREPIAVVGLGCLFPQADGVRAFWANVKHGVDAITDVPATHWRPDEYFDANPKAPDRTYARKGGFLPAIPFAPGEFGIAPNDLEATDTAQLLGLVVAKQALTDAGRNRPLERQRTSVILGVTGTLELVIPLGARLGHPHWRKALADAGVEPATAERVVAQIGDAYVGWQENSFPGLLGNVVAGRIANRLDLGGTNCVVDAACASSLSAVHLAMLELYAGRADAVVTGGVDTFNDIFMYMCFSKTPALSPTGHARPFSATGDGTTLGEGLGMVVLKRLGDARAAGDHIYALIKGLGTSSDGKGTAIYAPTSAGQVRCLERAYADAHVSPATIELLEAHGTGTKAGDAAELTALAQVYRQHAAERGANTWCAIGSVKSMIGHTKAAAGAAGLVKAILALQHKVLPPTLKVEQPQEAVAPGTTPFYVNTEKRPWLPNPQHPRRAAVSSFGFGGSNFHCVLEEATPNKLAPDWDGQTQILAFSGATPADVRAQVQAWTGTPAQTRAAFRLDAPCRLTVVVAPGSDSKKLLATAAERLTTTTASWHTPDGIYCGVGPVSGTLGVLFPGQGAQTVGMLRDLACTFPAFLDTLAEADRWFGSRLSDYLYPHPAFDAATKQQQQESLRATDVAQPALGAVSLGALRVLEGFGVRPAAGAGHSFGELTALCAAGVFDSAALHQLARTRGQLMARANGDAGAMLAVQASRADLEQLLAELRSEAVIANHNAPQQTVLSGPTPALNRVAEALQARNWRSTRLPVAAAFHSALVADASPAFRAALDAVQLSPAHWPVFANTTAQRYPTEARAVRQLLSEQLAKPVEFVQAIQAMRAAGVGAFLEVGPGSTLTRLVEAIVPGIPAFALDASAGKRNGLIDLAQVLARLAALGHAVDLTAWEPTETLPAKSATLTVPICGANYVNPKKKVPTGTSPEARKPLVASPPATPQKVMAPSDSLVQALRLTQDSLALFQKMQEQTASLHKQFLEGQDAAHRTLHLLMEQQQRLLLGTPLPAAPPVPLPPPIVVAPPVSPPPPVVVPPPPPPVVVPVVANRHVEQTLLAVVAEKTGYPAEMLDLDMGLDADLGIDSIKRVEILSALQERLPAAPQVKPEHLGTLHTLRHIVAFLAGGDTQPTPPPAREATKVPVVTANATHVEQTLLAVVAEKTGYPVEMLDLDMGLDADLGIDSIKRVEILSALQEKLPDAPQVKPEHLGTLHTLRHIAAFLAGAPAAPAVAPAAPAVAPVTTSAPPAPVVASATTAAPTELTRAVLAWRPLASERQPLDLSGLHWVIAEDDTLADAWRATGKIVLRLAWTDGLIAVPSNLRGLVLCPPVQTTDAHVFQALRWLRHAGPTLRHNGGLLASVARLDGRFGLRGLSGEPLAAAFAGLVKTARHEWTEVACKAIDWSADDLDPAAVIAELGVRGPIEVGLSAGSTGTLHTVSEPVPDTLDPLVLAGNDVVVITGGARGVTAEAALALAQTYQPTLLLLGRSPLTPEPDWLAGVTTEADLKRAVAAHHPGVSPKLVGEQCAQILAQREVRNNLARLDATGATILYRAVDVSDARAVAEVLRDVRQTHGGIVGLVHGAGVLADKRIEDKTDEMFTRVWQPKVNGLRALLAATADDALQFIALFSSTTARLGRVGQCDYAAANEVLNKVARQQALARPTCRVVAYNWGPWDGGMVTPALREVFAREGVGLIPLVAGAQALIAELDAGAPATEVVLLGTLAEPVAPEPSNLPSASATLSFERTLSMADAPVLRAHVIDGRSVLPMAVQMEWLAHAALHGNPGWQFHGLNELRIQAGVKLEAEQNYPVQLWAGKASKRDGLAYVPVELRGQRADGKSVIHTRAEVVLAQTLPTAPSATLPNDGQEYPHPLGEIYDHFLFHGPDLQGLTGISAIRTDGIVGQARTAPPPSSWLRQPLRGSWIAEPLVLDSAFQLLILWAFAQHGAGSLPMFAGRYRQYRRSFPAGPITIVAQVTADHGARARAAIEFRDSTGVVIARFDDYECVIDSSLNQAFRRNRLVQVMAP